MPAIINAISISKGYTAEKPWSVTVGFSTDKGMSGYIPMPEEAIHEILAVVTEQVNKTLPAAGEELAKAQIPQLIAPSTPEGEFVEVDLAEDIPF